MTSAMPPNDLLANDDRHRPFRRTGRIAAAVAVGALGIAACSPLTSLPTTPTQSGVQRTFYLDPAGSDSNSGLSTTSAWRTLAKLNKVALAPGDKAYLKRGASFTGVILPNGSGTAAAPIFIGAYGSGALPKVVGGANGDCVRILTSYVTVDSIAASGCSYDGFNVVGSHNTVSNSSASNMKVGIRINYGSSFGSYQHNTLTNNNVMMVNTRGTNCGTAYASHCNDDSGASGFLVHGDSNDIGYNTISGSVAASYDYGYDGAAFDVYNANRNLIHNNVSLNNLVLSELGRSGSGTASGNVFRANSITATCGAPCNIAQGITLRGSGQSLGPNPGTVIDGNTFNIVGNTTGGVICSHGCPASTVVTNNTFVAATRAIWMDGSGWKVSGNVIRGATIAQAGPTKRVVPAGSSITW